MTDARAFSLSTARPEDAREAHAWVVAKSAALLGGISLILGAFVAFVSWALAKGWRPSFSWAIRL
jgi:hypothetical protein